MEKALIVYFNDGKYRRIDLLQNDMIKFKDWIVNTESNVIETKDSQTGQVIYLFKSGIKYIELVKL